MIKENDMKVRLVQILILNQNQNQLKIHIFKVISNSELELSFVKNI